MQRVMTQLGDGADQAGLIHADLHLDNALFWRGDVRVIDFDDCGFGYWLYDIAVSLWELRRRDDYGQFRAALINGYTQHRPLPPGGLAHLDDFIATREVAFGLWDSGSAQVHPAFHADLPQVLGNIGHSLDTLIGLKPRRSPQKSA
jgi:Ser/Thr protein kinase RdoA (MazF antagonist)